MEPPIPQMDLLGLRQNKNIRKHFYVNESVFFSGKVTKYDGSSKAIRVLMITNYRICIVKKSILGNLQMHRSTLFKRLGGIVVSTTTDEFNILVPEEYDYWLSSQGIFRFLTASTQTAHYVDSHAVVQFGVFGLQ